MKRSVTTISVSVALFAITAICMAVDKDSKMPVMKQTAATSSAMTGKMQAFLGIGVDSLPPALTTQLSSLLGDGCGVLVADVASGSPADKAGLKDNDILVKYDDQRLYSPEQFVKLVRHDKPERTVTLGVIHAGKSEEIKVALGEHPAVAVEQQHPAVMQWPMSMRGERPMTAEEEEAHWRSFDSLTLSRIDKDHFKAEIKFRDDQGKLETHAFQGTLRKSARIFKPKKICRTTSGNSFCERCPCQATRWKLPIRSWSSFRTTEC